MTDVDATLVVDNGVGGTRALSVDDFKAPATGGATQTTLAAVLAKLSADPATQTTLAAVLAKLSSDPATQTTLAAVLAKLSGDPSTGAKQDTQAGKLDTLIAKDYATQTTLAAVLAKIIAAPATEAKQDSLATAVGLLAKLTDTQPVSAASLPLPAGAATAAKQDTGNTSVASIDTKTPALASGRVPVDPSGVTSPVSGPLTDAQLAARLPLSVDSSTADGSLGGDGTKNVTTAGTRVALAASTTCKWVIVTARPANTGKVVVGTVSCVAAAGSERGIVLAAGQSTGVPATNLANGT
jgi:hypothetical protein